MCVGGESAHLQSQSRRPSGAHAERAPSRDYERSLSVLSKVKAKRGDSIYTKSGMMLGLGECEDEVVAAMGDLRKANCDIPTLGQYLQPTLKHLPVTEFVTPEKFAELGNSVASWALFTSRADRWSAVPIMRTNSPCRQGRGGESPLRCLIKSQIAAAVNGDGQKRDQGQHHDLDDAGLAEHLTALLFSFPFP